MTKNSKIEISFNPTKNQLNEIENWLIEEMNLNGNSFYSNWGIIKSAYNENEDEYKKTELVTISEDNQTIGFIVWTWHCLAIYSATIDITAIKTSHRGKGFGKLLIDRLIQEFILKNIYAVNLQCAPSSSEPIWRHFGFIDFPADNYNNGINKRLYKVIIAHSEAQEIIATNEFLELWNKDVDSTKKIASTWKWNLIFKDGTRILEKPIIHPFFSCDWRIRLKKVNLSIIDDKVKYFSETDILFGDFIVIKEIPKLEI